MVTTAPSSESVESSLGIATISFSFESTRASPSGTSTPSTHAVSTTGAPEPLAHALLTALPSSDTQTPFMRPAAARCHRRTHTPNTAGRSMDSTRRNVSWLGTPFFSSRNSLRRAACFLP